MRAGWLLAAAMALGAACGGAGARSPGDGPETAAPGTVGRPGAGTATGSDAGAATDMGAAGGPGVGPMKPPRPSQMLDDLMAIGLDAKNLPPLKKLEPQTLRKLMKLFARSLGIKCAGCHAEPMDVMTPRKRAASQMWEHFVRGMTLADDSPLFCDSCHQGSVLILDRRDEKATKRWMDQSFVGGLKRKDGQENHCSTCHGEPAKGRFIDLWKQGKPFP